MTENTKAAKDDIQQARVNLILENMKSLARKKAHAIIDFHFAQKRIETTKEEYDRATEAYDRACAELAEFLTEEY